MAAMRRAFSSAERTVRRRWPRSGLAGPKVRGTSPWCRSRSAAASAASWSPMRTSRKLVTEGNGSPAGRGKAGGEPLALLDQATDVAGGDVGHAQGGRADGGRDRGHRAGRPVALQPGDRVSRRDGVADADARQGERLGHGAHDDELRIAVAQRHHRAAGELVIGLVDDDRRSGEPRLAAASRMASTLASGSSRPVGLLGTVSQTSCASPSRASMAGRSRAKPASGPRRGTAITRAGRWEVSTPYMP